MLSVLLALILLALIVGWVVVAARFIWRNEHKHHPHPPGYFHTPNHNHNN